MHDLVIRAGIVVDGTGESPLAADVAIDNGVITDIGQVIESGKEEIDATGHLVTPGFVDVHTHYDGQVTWDPLLVPSLWHGVTTAVMGNCGVGFAPVAPERREWLVGLMEGVEDIPGTALHAGIQWNWETFPEFLDYLDTLPLALDIGTQVPHGAVRAYVMGERGARNEPATPVDIAAMASIVREGIMAGALGFSMSRSLVHRAIDGEPVPGTFATEEEIVGICRPLAELGTGVIELAPAGVTGDDLNAPEKEIAWMRRLSASTGRPVTFALVQHDGDPRAWRRVFELSEEAAAEGADFHPQVLDRSVTGIFGLQSTLHPFSFAPTYAKLATLPLAECVAEMRKPEIRLQVISEALSTADDTPLASLVSRLDRFFPMGDPPNYEPSASDSVGAIAQREGRPAIEVLYDLMLQHDGRELLMVPLLNFYDFNLDAVREMLLHSRSVLGLGDAGAHSSTICDASAPTYMLTHWARDRAYDRLPLEFLVKKMTKDTAWLFGLRDRGVLRPGMKGDVNVIDYDHLRLSRPEMVYDLPTGARRLVQRADGYLATIVSGVVVMRDGEETGERPGRLVRGERRLAEARAGA